LQTLKQTSYWDHFAAAYANLGGPLRPSGEEIGLIEGIVREWTESRRIASPRALLLGATPAIAAMNWPAKTRLTGVDDSFPMAKSVWPGNVPGERAMVCGNWLAMPVREASCDVAVGDGSINCLSYPEGFRALAETVSRLLRGSGLLVLRCYLQAEPRESAEELHDEALRGSIGSFHTFKLRLLMALQRSAQAGIAVEDVYRWVRRHVDLSSLPERTGWSRASVETLEFYRDSATVYAFPTLDELRSELLPRFEEAALHVPTHEMGPRCPILVFEARSGQTAS
jgi:hypothetical protein